MTKMTIDRELLERVLYVMDNYVSHETSEEDQLRAILAAPRQPEGEEIAWSLRSDVAGCGLVRYMTDSKYQAQTPAIKQWYEPFRCQQCSDAQRAIAELREECEASESQAEYQRGRAAYFMVERDTLRQQLAERDAIIERPETGIPCIQEQSHQMRQQRDKLAGLLREKFPRIDPENPYPLDEVQHCCEYTLYQERERLHREIDAALAEVSK